MRRIVAALVLLALSLTPAGAQTPGDGTGGATCHVRGALPDPACTPGSILTTDPATVCTSGYAATVRNVSDATRDTVYAEYGITDRTGYNIDHLIALEDGGSNEITNLWPERVDEWPGAHEKDYIEGALYRGICAGRVSMPDAQRWLATDWRMALLEPAGT